MSEEIPERRDLLRSTVLTILFTVVFVVLGLAFWAWSSLEVIATSPVGAINEFNPAVTVVLEVLIMFMTFVFLLVTVINLRLALTNIRAGWTEVIITVIFIAIMSTGMFALFVGSMTVILSLGFVVYLYLIQD